MEPLNVLNMNQGVFRADRSLHVMKLVRAHRPTSERDLFKIINDHYGVYCPLCGQLSVDTIDGYALKLFESQEAEWKEAKFTYTQCYSWTVGYFVTRSYKGWYCEQTIIAHLETLIVPLTVSESSHHTDQVMRVDAEVMNKDRIVCGLQIKPESYMYVPDYIKNDIAKAHEQYPRPVFTILYEGECVLMFEDTLVDKIIEVDARWVE
jgi:hypothetical protein